jgi:hypothetical protein
MSKRNIQSTDLPSSVVSAGSSRVYYGAPSGGDDTAGLQTALNALTQGQILTLESGQVYKLTSGSSLSIPTTYSDIGIDGSNAIIRATATLTGPVLTTSSLTVPLVRGLFRDLILDCNGYAYNGFYPTFFQHIVVDNVTVLTPNQHGVIFGSSSATAASYEAMCTDLHIWNASGVTPPAGYAGVYYQNCTDSSCWGTLAVGADIGIWNASADNHFFGCHTWGHATYLPSCNFYDVGGGDWHGCTADNPGVPTSAAVALGIPTGTPVGWYIGGTNKESQIFGGLANNGASPYGTNNIASVFYVASGTTAFIMGVNIDGSDASHNWLNDIQFAGGYVSTTYLPGQRYNVTNMQHARIYAGGFEININGNLVFDGATNTIGTSAFTLSPDGVYSVGPLATTQTVINGWYAQTLSTAGGVTFDASKGNHNQVTLAANATSSTIANPPSTAYNIAQDLTLEIVQDGTGGRTYTPPTNVKWAGGTAPTWSTTAGYIDIVVLTWKKDVTNWYEKSRSIGLH